MIAADFSAFYKAVHGYHPFPWQQRLLENVVLNGWPAAISLPTSSGKTSVIDVAVFHLAMEAGKNSLHRKAPLRIFFVIDRRVVVDEAAEHATKIAQALIESTDKAVAPVKEALARFGAEYPLDVAVLRGGMYRDNTWADEPNQPLVCVSTVDQIGSRLLFRGYQVSDEARPVHAGLVGNDSLVIVDEAHLSRPFWDTLLAVHKRNVRQRQISHGITLVQMSATLDKSGDKFKLDQEDYSTPELSGRLLAAKLTELRAPSQKFEAEVVTAAKKLAGLPNVSVVGVILNTVAAARAVFEDLRQVKAARAILLTGRNRPFKSQELWNTYKTRIAAQKGRNSEGTFFLVATQTVEVGANLDFDALVSESAPLDSLRQRFGRLNRLGKPGDAHAIIVKRPDVDPVYGEVTDRTWSFLSGLAKVDFGVAAMDAVLLDHDSEAFSPEKNEGPLVFAKYLAMWAQTNPAPDPDPDVAPFLHGQDALEDADIQIVWRDDVIEGVGGEEWQKAVELAPPLSSESLALPLGTVRRWLSGEKKLVVADIEGAPAGEEDRGKQSKNVLVWRGRTVDKPLTDIRQIRPGDVVVVPSTYGGCDDFGWNPSSAEPVQDLGDLANDQMAEKGLRRFRVRLDLFAKRLNDEEKARFKELLNRARTIGDDGFDAEAREEIASWLSQDKPKQLPKPKIDSSGRVALWEKILPKGKTEIQPTLKPEDQDDDSVGQRREILLSNHVAGVVRHARLYAERCGLDSDLVADIVLAAELHDLGKWDERFQAWLSGTSVSLRRGEPLAKSRGTLTLAERKAARKRANYPEEARHELASVPLACASGALSRAHDRELVLHLIGTHHGYGRPLPPVWEEDDGQSVSARFTGVVLETDTGNRLGRFDSGWIEKFETLNRRYGYWGLAYLETILRRADCVQSRKEQDE